MVKRTRGSVLFSWSTLVLVLSGVWCCLTAPPVHAAVGRTAGNFNVSSSGAATYSIPIFTPPGPRGVQPSVALVYSSNARVGYLGRGWSLAGFSSITRCNRTVAQDGAGSPISLLVSDGYCLDGNRLRLQSGTYGTSGSVYATEIADFSRITAVNSAGSGPQYWTVERKDGLTYTYGGTSDSRAYGYAYSTSTATQWMVSQISDRSGNKVVFTYKTADGTTYGITHPTKVEWTQTSAGSGSYVYSMDFSYSAGGNAAASTYSAVVFESPILEADLLTAITVSVSGTLKRNYMLTYDTSPTSGAKRLTEVKECADSGPSPTDCLSPTAITYQNGSAGMDVSSPILSETGNITAADGSYDFNGDGTKDIAYQRSGIWYVRLGSFSGGYGTEISTGLSALRAGKLRGNRADQLLGDYSGTWYVYDLISGSFSGTSTGIATANAPDAVVSDVNGDGRDDLAYVKTVTTVTAINPYDLYPYVGISVRLNTSTGGSISFASAVDGGQGLYWLPHTPNEWEVPPGTQIHEAIYAYSLTKGGDLNGDRRQELNLDVSYYWCYYGPSYGYSCNYAAATLTAWADSGSYLFLTPILDASWFPSNARVTSNDFNRDGCYDYMLPSGAIGLSNCYDRLYTTIGSGYLGGADYTGDGMKDLVYQSGSTLYVEPFLGTGPGSAVNTTIPATSACQLITTDGNGDGLDDFGCLVSGSSLTLYKHNGTNVVPDLVASIADGFGVTYSPSYTSIASSTYTPYTDATYPYRDMTGDRAVVGSTTASDGIGGTYTTTYSYFGGWDNVQGRGFQGFDKIEAVDSRNSVKRAQKFKRVFPYGGMPYEDSSYQSGGTPMGSRTVTASYYTLDSTAYNERFFPYMSASTEDSYEVGGTKNGVLIQQSATSNTYDYWGNLTASTRTVTDKDNDGINPFYNDYWTQATSQTFSPNTTYWCLGLPTDVSVTSSSSVSGETSITRSKSFTPDYAYCRHTAEDVEPSGGNRRVQTAYGFDAFGNINSVSVTGRNPNGSSMTARSSGISWGTTGQFAVAETNALSQTTTRTFHPTFGSLLTETDPNGIVVANNTYDAFGRVSRTTRADGTSTFYSYELCAPNCENGAPGTGGSLDRYFMIAWERDTGDSHIRLIGTHFDQFDRPFLQHTEVSPGSYSRVGREYDAMGRLYREHAPTTHIGGTAYWTTNTYDLLGRVTAQSRPQSQSVSTPVTTTYTYAGRTQTVTDPNSKVTTKILDVNGWMRRSQDHDGYYQTFSYDGAGSLKAVTDPLSNPLFSASYSYGIQAFQDSSTDMDLGGTTYSHNSLGELVSWTDAKSQSFSQTYDALSRVTSRTEAEGTTTWTWGTTAGSHNIGSLAGISMTGYSESLTYDSVGRPSTRSITTDQTYDIDYAYNNQGFIDTLTYPQSTSSTRVKVKYGYYYGHLQSVTDWTTGSAGTVYWTANAQNPRGQTTQETLGNGVVTNRSFDAVTGWLNSIQSGVSGGTGLQNQSYLYDLVGNITQRQESTLGLTENFYYDNLYRLDYSQLNSSTNLDLTYDAMGNITNRTDVNGNASWTYHSTKKHAVASTGSGGTTYTYDNNGNMLTRGGTAIQWTSYNYPEVYSTGTESARFYYGPDRQYYKQIYYGPGVYESTDYIGGLLEKVSDGSVTDWRHYIQAEGQTVAIVSRKSNSVNAVNYPLEDNQGSGSTLTNSSGTAVVRQSYNAFGLPRDGADWDGAEQSGDQITIDGISRRGYTGHSMLGATGLIHMNGRVQDAITGRFLSPDPNIPNPGFTQSYNRYAYVNNNPLSFIDPSGFADESTHAYMAALCSNPNSGWSNFVEISPEKCAFMNGFVAAAENGSLDWLAIHRSQENLCLFDVKCHQREVELQRAKEEKSSKDAPQSGIPPGVGAKSYGEAEEVARRIANEELERTRRITDGYRLGGHNDLYDAERHARWTYRMSMEIGSGWAGAFATGHELQESLSQPRIEMRMDLNNNAVGMQAAMNGSGIPTRSTPGLVYIANGQLQGY